MPFRVVVTLFLLLAVAGASEAPCGFPNYAFPPQPRCDLASEESDDPEANDAEPDRREVAPDPTPTTRADDAAPSDASSDAPAGAVDGPVQDEPAGAPQPAPTGTSTAGPVGTGVSATDETGASSPPPGTPSVTDADRPAMDAADDVGDRGSTGPTTAGLALVLLAVSAVGMVLGTTQAGGGRRRQP